jgi:repressor LexA
MYIISARREFIMKQLASNLKSLRNKLGYSQTEMANKAEVSQTTINRWEQNVVNPPIEKILWYADFFDVSLDWLFGRTENPMGATFSNNPSILKERMQDKKEWQQFVKLCFEPNSKLNLQLQEAILKLSEEG